MFVINKITVKTIQNKKIQGEKIAMLTAYDYSTAKILDNAGVDIILVGDSLGMVMLGYDDTTKVTMEDMLHHTKAVSRGVKNALIVADMPFLSYHTGVYDAVSNAGKFVRDANASAVKLEGGKEVLDSVSAIINAGIPVMGHLGLTPQSVNVFGGYVVQGKTEKKAQKLIDDALYLQEAGVFSIVLECVPQKLSEIITQKLDIPTIGIGAGINCSGQVLVTHDILGLYGDFTPSFVKKYENMQEKIDTAIKNYIDDVKGLKFPEDKHTFSMPADILDKIN